MVGKGRIMPFICTKAKAYSNTNKKKHLIMNFEKEITN